MVLTDRVSVRGPAFFVVGNTRTQIVRFTIGRYIDGVDLSALAWAIHIKNADGVEDVAMPNMQPEIKDDKIVVEWLVKDIATAAEGDLTFCLRGVASDEDGMPIRWSSGDMKRPVHSAQESTPTPDQATELAQIDALIEYVNNELPALLEAVHDATHNVPYIGDNGNWFIWDAETGAYVDSGKPSWGGGSGGAVVAGVSSVNGKTGDVQLTPQDVGAASAEEVARLSEEIGNVGDGLVTAVEPTNLFDVATMGLFGKWYWFANVADVGYEIELQDAAWYYAVKVPVTGKSKVTFSTNSPNSNFYSWFATTANLIVITYESGLDITTGRIGDGYTIDIPEGAEYLCMSLQRSEPVANGAYWLMVNEGDTALPYEPHTGESYLMAHGKRLLTTEDAEVAAPVSLKLPDRYAAVVGDTFELFYKGIINAVNPETYYIDLDCDIGAVYTKRFIATPTSSDVGDHDLRVRLYDQDHALLDEKTVVLSVKAKAQSPDTEKVVLYVGDSLAVGGGTPGEFKRRLTAADGSPVGDGLSNITFIGTCSGNGANYEGWGGYSFETYTTAGTGNTFMWITCVHDKTADDQHSVYKDTNENQWKLETIESGRIKLIRVGAGVLPATGTLNWVSGGVNHTDIVYTASEQVSGNPFWDETAGANNFAAYAQQFGKSTIDYVYVLLGWNSAMSSRDEYKAQAKKFADDVHASFPDCKIIYLGLQIPARDGLGANYGATGVYSRYYDLMQHVFVIDEIYKELSEMNPNKISVVNIAGQFDTEHNMITAERAVNVRNSETEVYQSNGVHPAHVGQYQIADACYRDFVHKLQS